MSVENKFSSAEQRISGPHTGRLTSGVVMIKNNVDFRFQIIPFSWHFESSLL